MAQRRHHYEQAFEEYLRARRIPCVAVDEAKKSLLPVGLSGPSAGEAVPALKSFDFVIYGEGQNLLAEVKGRRIGRRTGLATPGKRSPAPRLESWVTLDDVSSLQRWEGLFGPEFAAAFIFVYWCEQQPPDALFHEMFESHGRWYALRAVRVADYARVMRVRSASWRTVDVPRAAFERISSPFSAPGAVDEGLGRNGLDAPWGFGHQLPALQRLA